jgi:hypothetical protein
MTSFINDSGSEIYSGDNILITKQVASFKNFKIKGDVSVSFTVPNTSQNRKALGYYGLNQVGGPVFSVNTFNCVKDGNVIMRGNLIIESDNGKELGLYFISGNANWFRLFEFSCKDIRNDSLMVRWTYYWNDATKANTSGIVFPAIDLMYKGYKFDKYSFNERLVDSSFSSIDLYNPVNNTPCLYMNTLVIELAKLAEIRIDGTLLDDPLYKALIITPEGPDLFNDTGQISTFRVDSQLDGSGFAENVNIYIQNIVPDIKAIEVIKWLCVSFGCVPVFDEYSQTLSLNIIDRFRKEDAEDWSAYFKGYTIRYDQYQNNWIRVNSPEDDYVNEYNKFNDTDQSEQIPFGESNLTSDKVDGSSQDVYTSPFLPSFQFSGGVTPLYWDTPFVEFYKLEDDGYIEFTSVSNVGGKATFNCASVDVGIEPAVNATCIIRVDDGVGANYGYHNIDSITATTLGSTSDYVASTSGTLYIQKITKVNKGSRVLVAIPNFSVSDFTANANFNVYTFGNVTNATYAYYHKFTGNYSDLNRYKLGLSYGHIQTVSSLTLGAENDIPLEERYLQPIKRMIEGPTTEAVMLLPESVFDNYNFDKFVYIKNKDFQGYFFVDSIQNYKDGKTLVRVDLLTV